MKPFSKLSRRHLREPLLCRGGIIFNDGARDPGVRRPCRIAILQPHDVSKWMALIASLVPTKSLEQLFG